MSVDRLTRYGTDGCTCSPVHPAATPATTRPRAPAGGLDLQPRRAGAHVDLGADESDGTAWPDLAVLLHVNPAGNDAADGLSGPRRRRPTTRSEAASAPRGGEVWIAAGTYLEHPMLGLGPPLRRLRGDRERALAA